MKRGRVNITSKCPGFPSPDARIKRQKSGPLGPSLAQRLAEDWGNLPHHVVMHIFQYLSLVDRARASSVCRRWNEVFHIPDLWRRFEFELNQPATSYLKSTHPDLIQQIIKRHAQHLQYVSFKVETDIFFNNLVNSIVFQRWVWPCRPCKKSKQYQFHKGAPKNLNPLRVGTQGFLEPREINDGIAFENRLKS